MNRRSIITMTGATIVLTVNKLFPGKVVAEPKKSISIPQSIVEEIAEIIAQGGKITGYSYEFPRDAKTKFKHMAGVSGQRWLTKEDDCKWKVV